MMSAVGCIELGDFQNGSITIADVVAGVSMTNAINGGAAKDDDDEEEEEEEEEEEVDADDADDVDNKDVEGKEAEDDEQESKEQEEDEAEGKEADVDPLAADAGEFAQCLHKCLSVERHLEVAHLRPAPAAPLSALFGKSLISLAGSRLDSERYAALSLLSMAELDSLRQVVSGQRAGTLPLFQDDE